MEGKLHLQEDLSGKEVMQELTRREIIPADLFSKYMSIQSVVNNALTSQLSDFHPPDNSLKIFIDETINTIKELQRNLDI